GEGGGASTPSTPSNYGLFSVLSLDMSGSIFARNAQGAVFDAAEAFVRATLLSDRGAQNHKVALQVFGRSADTRIVAPFTSDGEQLLRVLTGLRMTQGSLGSTNLYGAYRGAIRAVQEQGRGLEFVERAVVIFTDGVHEAGDFDNQRQLSLMERERAEREANLTSFSVYLGAPNDTEAISSIRELASREQNFRVASGDDLSTLARTFEEVAAKLDGISRSNYAVGICTPVELGVGSLTIAVEVNGVRDSIETTYPTEALNGDVRLEACVPQIVALCPMREEVVSGPVGGAEGGGGGAGGASAGYSGGGGAQGGYPKGAEEAGYPVDGGQDPTLYSLPPTFEAGWVVCGDVCALEAPAASLQAGVCAGGVKVCTAGRWAEPNYALVEGYGAEACDAIDNDCDGVFDEGLSDCALCTPMRCPTPVQWVTIPAGSFQMGSAQQSDEQPVHAVTLQAFELAQHEVTVGQYRRCVEQGPCVAPEQVNEPQTECAWSAAPSGREDRAMNCLTWAQARTFARWAGGDLPTEAEWEYAARAGTPLTYAGSSAASDVGWSRENSDYEVKPVRALQGNAYMLYDMSGNVREWVLDEWSSSYVGANSDGQRPFGAVPSCAQPPCAENSARRVMRGGSAFDPLDALRVTNRDRVWAYDYSPFTGFRPRRVMMMSGGAFPADSICAGLSANPSEGEIQNRLTECFGNNCADLLQFIPAVSAILQDVCAYSCGEIINQMQALSGIDCPAP
ncbi:MAG: VWA domain-containing protein, partial [Deltaproteobacteria bacterium]|nr:VWA domain-containing protein [Deltaproteobacteria bacterium]